MAQPLSAPRATTPSRTSRLSSRSATLGSTSQAVGVRAPFVLQGGLSVCVNAAADSGPFAGATEAAAAASSAGPLPLTSSVGALTSPSGSPGLPPSAPGCRKLVPTLSGPSRQPQQQPRSASHPRSAGRARGATAGTIWGTMVAGSPAPALTNAPRSYGSGAYPGAGHAGSFGSGFGSAGMGYPSGAAGTSGGSASAATAGGPLSVPARSLRPSSSRRCGGSGALGGQTPGSGTAGSASQTGMLGNAVVEPFGAASVMSGLIQTFLRPRTSPEPTGGSFASTAAAAVATTGTGGAAPLSANTSSSSSSSGGFTGGSHAFTSSGGLSGPAGERLSPDAWGSAVRPNSASPCSSGPGAGGTSAHAVTAPGEAQHAQPAPERPSSWQQIRSVDASFASQPAGPGGGSTPALPPVGGLSSGAVVRRGSGSASMVPLDGLPVGPSRLYEAIARHMDDSDLELGLLADVEDLYSSGVDDGGDRPMTCSGAGDGAPQPANRPQDSTPSYVQHHQQLLAGEAAPELPQQQKSLQEHQFQAYARRPLEPKPAELQLRALSFDAAAPVSTPPSPPHPQPPSCYNPLHPTTRGRESWTGNTVRDPASTGPLRASSPPLVVASPHGASHGGSTPAQTPTGTAYARFPALAFQAAGSHPNTAQHAPQGLSAARPYSPVVGTPPREQTPPAVAAMFAVAQGTTASAGIAAAVADLRQLLSVAPSPAQRAGSFSEELAAGAAAAGAAAAAASAAAAVGSAASGTGGTQALLNPQPHPHQHMQTSQQQQRLGAAAAAAATANGGRPYIVNKMRLNVGRAGSSGHRFSDADGGGSVPLPGTPVAGGSSSAFPEGVAPREASWGGSSSTSFSALEAQAPYSFMASVGSAAAAAVLQRGAAAPLFAQPPSGSQQQQRLHHQVFPPAPSQQQQQPQAYQQPQTQQQLLLQHHQQLLQRQLQQQHLLLLQQQHQQQQQPQDPQSIRQQQASLQQQQQQLLMQKQQLGRIVSLATAVAAGAELPDCFLSASAAGPPLDWDTAEPAAAVSPRRLVMAWWGTNNSEACSGSETAPNRPSTARPGDRSFTPSAATAPPARARAGAATPAGGGGRAQLWMEGSSQLLAASQQVNRPHLWVYNVVRPAGEAAVWLTRIADSAPSGWDGDLGLPHEQQFLNSRGYLEGLRAGTGAVEADIDQEEVTAAAARVAETQRTAAQLREPQPPATAVAKVQTWRPREPLPVRRPRTRSAGTRRGRRASSTSGGSCADEDADQDDEEERVKPAAAAGVAARGRPRPRPPDMPRPSPTMAAARKPRPPPVPRGPVRARTAVVAGCGDGDSDE